MIINVYYEFENLSAIKDKYPSAFTDEQWDEIDETLSDYKHRIKKILFNGTEIIVTMEENEDPNTLKITGIGKAPWIIPNPSAMYTFS